MRKVNRILAIVLAVICMVSCAGNYFSILAMPCIVVSFIFSVFIAFMAMMQVLNYQGCENHNPGLFWFVYSAVSGVALIVLFYGAGFKLIDEQFSTSLIIGLAPMILPILGVFVGDLGRILFNGDPSIV